jgi:DNA replication protein DnaD
MSRILYDYTKSVLVRVSFDTKLFCKELEKAIKELLPYEVDQLKQWLVDFVKQNPELKPSLKIINV